MHQHPAYPDDLEQGLALLSFGFVKGQCASVKAQDSQVYVVWAGITEASVPEEQDLKHSDVVKLNLQVHEYSHETSVESDAAIKFRDLGWQVARETFHTHEDLEGEECLNGVENCHEEGITSA